MNPSVLFGHDRGSNIVASLSNLRISVQKGYVRNQPQLTAEEIGILSRLQDKSTVNTVKIESLKAELLGLKRLTAGTHVVSSEDTKSSNAGYFKEPSSMSTELAKRLTEEIKCMRIETNVAICDLRALQLGQ